MFTITFDEPVFELVFLRLVTGGCEDDFSNQCEKKYGDTYPHRCAAGHRTWFESGGKREAEELGIHVTSKKFSHFWQPVKSLILSNLEIALLSPSEHIRMLAVHYKKELEDGTPTD